MGVHLLPSTLAISDRVSVPMGASKVGNLLVKDVELLLVSNLGALFFDLAQSV
jgi:hypothetical protein